MSMFAALQSLGTELALTSMRRARIEQGRAKLAAAPHMPPMHAPAVKPKLPGGKSPTAPARLGQTPTVQVATTVSGSKPPKTVTASALESALDSVLDDKVGA
jgi:hypothetical protein